MHLWTQMVGCGGVVMPIRTSKHRQKVPGSRCISASPGKAALWIPVLFAHFSGPDKTIGFMFGWICKSMLPLALQISFILYLSHGTLHCITMNCPSSPWGAEMSNLHKCRTLRDDFLTDDDENDLQIFRFNWKF